MKVGKRTRVLNVDNFQSEERGSRQHLIEIVCDADHAGNRATRKSISSVQIYLDGNLARSIIFRRVRVCLYGRRMLRRILSEALLEIQMG